MGSRPVGRRLHDPESRQMIEGSHMLKALSASRVTEAWKSAPGLMWLVDPALRIVDLRGQLPAESARDAAALRGVTVAQWLETNESECAVVAAHRRALAGEHVSFSMTLHGQSFHGQTGPWRHDEAIIGCVSMALSDPTPAVPWTSIADTMIDLVLFLDFSGRICEVHGTAGRLHRHQVLNRPVNDFIPPDSHEPLRQAMQTVRDTGRTTTLEMRFTRRYGESSWQMMRIGPIEQHGRMIGLVLLASDISPQKQALQKLQAEETLLRDLLELQDRERRMVAYEIHDGFIQDVVGARMVLQGMRPALHATAPGCLKAFDGAVTLLGQAVNEGRRLISELRPMIIDEMGIVDALEFLIAEEEARGELQIRFTHRIQQERLPALLQATVFRIVREAINNARRHGSATEASIRLTQIGNSTLILEIQDNGRGFNPDQVPADRYGLVSIRERAQLFGGGATIESNERSGTRITVKLATDVPPSVRDSAATDPDRPEGRTPPDWTW